jgi:hypothetical protein
MSNVGHQREVSSVAEWSMKDWLESLAYVVAIVGGLSATFVYFYGVRNEAISETRKAIARAWTNEGDITSEEARFITFELENNDGDLIGSLSTNASDTPLEVHANVGWFSTRIHISLLQGRDVIPIAAVNLTLTGNNNRLEWKLSGDQGADVLPRETVLWPSSVEVSR